MPRNLRLKSDAEPSQRLFDWLRMFDVPPWLYHALQGGEDAGVTLGSTEYGSMLQHLDPDRFRAELYRAHGGLLRDLAGLSDSAIAELRALIPPPDAEGPQVAPDDAAFVLPPLDEDSAPARKRTPSDIPPDHPDFTLPPLDDDLISPKALHPSSDTSKPRQSSAAKTVNTEPSEPLPVTPRSRPRRKIAAKPARTATPGSGSATTTRKAPRKPKAPPKPRRATQRSPAAAPDTVRVAQGDPELTKLLHLWSELQPQGRRAALWYLSALVVEER